MYDVWEELPDGHVRYVYSPNCEEAKKHTSGWAMRNTNNHNVNILKKSCLGVLVCSKRCIQRNGNPVSIRPAICDKARKKQQGFYLNSLPKHHVMATRIRSFDSVCEKHHRSYNFKVVWLVLLLDKIVWNVIALLLNKVHMGVKMYGNTHKYGNAS